MNIKKKYDSKDFRLIVTSGPTREWIDPVRFISNPSSGKIAYYIANYGLNLFKEVIYIAGYTDHFYKFVSGAKNISVDTTNSMAEAVFNELQNQTLLIMAAAPADYTPSEFVNEKIKKNHQETVLHLKPTIDILKTIGLEKQKEYHKLILVGFAAETHNLMEYALEKLKKKNIHFICGNQVFKNEYGFGENVTTVHVYDKWGGEISIGPIKKELIGSKILDYINNRLTEIYDEI